MQGLSTKHSLGIQHLSLTSLPWAIGSLAQKFSIGFWAATHDGGTTSCYFKLCKCLQNFSSFLWKIASRWPCCSYTCISSWCNVTELTLKFTGLDQFSSQSWQTAIHSFLMALIFSWAPELRRSMADPAGCQTWHKGRWTRKLESAAELRRRKKVFFPFWHQQQSYLI